MIKYLSISTLLIMLFQAACASNPEAAQLIKAAAEGKLEVVRSLLESKVDPNSVDGDGRTALHWAAWENHPQVVQLLLERGALIDAQDNNGDTPLILAGAYGSLDAWKVLIDNGADDTIANKDKKTVLTAIVDIPDYRNISPNTKEEMLDYLQYASTSPLIRALLKQEPLSVIAPLVDAATINAYDNHGRTPLIAVIDRSDNDNMVDFLLSKKADPNLSSKDNVVSPLISAVQKNRVNIARRLLQEPNIDLNQRNFEQRTPLMFATDRAIDIARMLINKKADIEAVDANKRTALAHAAHGLQAEIVKLLVNNGASINVQDASGDSPLLLAAQRVMGILDKQRLQAAKEIIAFLLDNGADTQLTNNKKISLSYLADKSKILHTLLEKYKERQQTKLPPEQLLIALTTDLRVLAGQI